MVSPCLLVSGVSFSSTNLTVFYLLLWSSEFRSLYKELPRWGLLRTGKLALFWHTDQKKKKKKHKKVQYTAIWLINLLKFLKRSVYIPIVTKIDHDLFSFVSWLNGAGRKVLDEARLPWVYILNQDHLPLWA